jgi:hypothetical protein
LMDRYIQPAGRTTPSGSAVVVSADFSFDAMAKNKRGRGNGNGKRGVGRTWLWSRKKGERSGEERKVRKDGSFIISDQHRMIHQDLVAPIIISPRPRLTGANGSVMDTTISGCNVAFHLILRRSLLACCG